MNLVWRLFLKVVWKNPKNEVVFEKLFVAKFGFERGAVHAGLSDGMSGVFLNLVGLIVWCFHSLCSRQ